MRDVANAPPRRYINPKEPVLVSLVDRDGKSVHIPTTHDEASKLHFELGQTLARMMRRRGSATPPEGPTGGTPVAMRIAA